MDELVAFLRARLQEDADLAYSGERWRYVQRGAGVAVPTADGEPVAAVMGDRSDHIARHDPARVLAEVEAKRSVIAFYEKAVRDAGRPPFDNAVGKAAALSWEFGVRCVALPYRDHPDYQAEWAPEEE